VRAPRIRLVRIASAAAAGVAAGSTGVTQERAPDVAQGCIYQPSIEHTRILDDRNILFYMHDRIIYQNTLPEQCYSLYARNRFTYGEARGHRLCMNNLITVVEDPADILRGGVSRGNLCKLGAFVPVDAEVADDLVAAANAPRKTRNGTRPPAVTAAPVELPPTAATQQNPQGAKALAPTPEEPRAPSEPASDKPVR
jgi:hypothetical protein